MPSSYNYYCPDCGWHAERYRNIKKCPRCSRKGGLKRAEAEIKPYDIAREGLAEWIYGDKKNSLPWSMVHESWKQGKYKEQVDALLSLKIPHGGKTIRFGPYWEDAELPQVTEEARKDRKWVAAFACALTEMLKAGWRKRIEE